MKPTLFGEEEEDEEPEVLYDRGFTHQQQAMVENSAVLIEEREREIQSIVQSIAEINEMYRDLATMIVDQVQWAWQASCMNQMYRTLSSKRPWALEIDRQKRGWVLTQTSHLYV